MIRIRKFFVPIAAALVGFGVAAPLVAESAITNQDSMHSSELGLYNNGTTASQLGVTVQVVSDYAYDPDWTTYAPSGAEAAKGKLLMLAVGVLTPAQAT